VPTYLETLGQREVVAEQIEVLRLDRDQKVLDGLIAAAKPPIYESDPWARRDPFQGARGIPAGLGNSPNDLMPYGAIGFHNARPGSRRDGGMPPFYRTLQQHWMIVDAARTLEALCPTAVNILDVLQQFVIFTGFSYTIVDTDKPELTDAAQLDTSTQRADDGQPETRDAADPQQVRDNVQTSKNARLVKEAQKFLDAWRKRVDWYSWEIELFRRSRLDGEAFLVMEEDATGQLGLRSVEPEQVKEPQDQFLVNRKAGVGSGHSWRFGILTTKQDTSKPLAYWVVSQYSDASNQGEMFDADEVFHLKTEWVPRQTKRGISDFFSVANDIPGTKKLLRFLRESATVQASVAWVISQPKGQTAPIQLAGGKRITTRTGDVANARVIDQVREITVPDGTEYTAGPLAGTGKSQTLIEVLQAALRNIGARWQMPEGIVSGDASNANLASALVAEGPFTRALESRQYWYRQRYMKMMERVLEHAAATGQIGGGEEIMDLIEVSVETPPVISRKAKEETERNQILSQNSILSPEDWAARETLDYAEQRAKIAANPLQPMEVTLMGMGIEADENNQSEANQERDT